MLMVRLDWSYQDEIFFEASETALGDQDDYEILDARIALRAHQRLREHGRLEDELVKTHIVAFSPYHQRSIPISRLEPTA